MKGALTPRPDVIHRESRTWGDLGAAAGHGFVHLVCDKEGTAARERALTITVGGL